MMTHIIVPAAQLGVLGAIGIAFALVSSLTLIPAILSLLPVPPPVAIADENAKNSALERGLERFAELVVARPKAIIAALAVMTAVASSGLLLLKVDTNPVNYYESDAPVAVTSAKVNRYFGGSTEVAVMFEGDIRDPAVMQAIDAVRPVDSDFRIFPLRNAQADAVLAALRGLVGERVTTVIVDADGKKRTLQEQQVAGIQLGAVGGVVEHAGVVAAGHYRAVGGAAGPPLHEVLFDHRLHLAFAEAGPGHLAGQLMGLRRDATGLAQQIQFFRSLAESQLMQQRTGGYKSQGGLATAGGAI
jgi:uncharacterized membrane protein YdfJ with MMPL/SSD domain